MQAEIFLLESLEKRNALGEKIEQLQGESLELSRAIWSPQWKLTKPKDGETNSW